MHPLPLVCFNEVSAGFGERLVFSRLSLSLMAGEHLALLGPNGAGKSTLLRLLQGELRPAQHLPGSIFFGFGGQKESSALAAKEHVRLVSPAQQRQYVRQGWKITGEEIILSGLSNAAMLYGALPPDRHERAVTMARAADAEDMLTLTAPAMSQGQLRLALILRALMARPALLLLDEPFDGLDTAARAWVSRAIALAMKRSTVLISAHRKSDIPEEIENALIIDNGTVIRALVADASMTLIEDAVPDTPDMPADTAPPCLSSTNSPFARRLLAGAAPVLRLDHVDVFIERNKVLSNICWTIRPGEQWIVSGRNGSGKSTLLRLLHGEEFAAVGGTIAWGDEAPPPLQELRKNIGYVSDRLQDTYDYDLCAEDVVISGFSGHIGLYAAPSRQERALARFWLERMGLVRLAGVNFHSLSSGTMRRVLLARALAASPPVLLLDEPLSGLDENSRRHFLDALPRLAARGVQIIYVSHHEKDKSALFSHELRLKQGKVVYAGPRRDIK